MRVLPCVLLLMFSVLTVAQGDKERWERIYTSQDSIIEINASKVTFGTAHIGRVRFRTIYSKPQTLNEKSVVKYKSKLETIEFQCAEKRPGVIRTVPPGGIGFNNAIRYRLYEAILLDEKGKAVRTYEWDPSEDWRVLKLGSMMEKLSGSACKLIDEKRRNP